jgi:hypothetical protein
MRRAITIVLVACLVLLGTGAVQHIHHWQHAQTPSAGAADAVCPTGHKPDNNPTPDIPACKLCLQLHHHVLLSWLAPSLFVHAQPMTNCSAEILGVAGSLRVDRLDCRGPPARVR